MQFLNFELFVLHGFRELAKGGILNDLTGETAKEYSV